MKDNLLLTKIPDRVTNILKGIGIIAVAFVLSSIIFFVIIISGFRGDVQGPNRSITAWLVSGIIFLASLIKAIKIIFRPIIKN